MADTHKSCTPTHRAIRQSTHVVIAKGLLLLLLSQHVAVCDECWIVFRMMFLTHSLTHFFLLLFPGAAGEKELGNCRRFCKRTGGALHKCKVCTTRSNRKGMGTRRNPYHFSVSVHAPSLPPPPPLPPAATIVNLIKLSRHADSSSQRRRHHHQLPASREKKTLVACCCLRFNASFWH